MRTDTANFISKNEAAIKRPRYSVQVSFDNADTDTVWLTSHADCEVPDSATVIHNVLSDITGTSQRMDPIKAVSSIGAIDFTAVDIAGALTSLIETKLTAGDGLRHKRIRVYVGYQDLAWADYALVQTQIIDGISFNNGAYNFQCRDIQRTAKKNIFDPKLDNLKATIDDAQTAFVVYDTSDFETVFHGTSYSDSPSSTVGYIKVEKEICRWLSKVETVISETGTDISFSGNVISSTSTDLSVFSDKQILNLSGTGGGGQNDGERFITGTPTSTSITVTGDAFITETASANINILADIQFYDVTRGALNTKAVLHEVDLTADTDKRTKVEELIYLELPLVKLLLAVLTGTLQGDSASLPDHWHLGIPAAYVSTSSLTGIGTDWWDTTDDTLGFPARFVGLTKTSGKTFYEKELLLLIGAYLVVQADGQLSLRRMNRILAGAPYIATLDETNIVNYTDLTHDMAAVHNQFRIEWNWEINEKRLTRTYLLTDQGSVSKHGAADTIVMKFRGMDGSNHTQAAIATRTDSSRDRHAGPPQLVTVTCLHHMNRLEVGDVVLYNMRGIKDYVTGEDVSRSMEIQQISMNWLTGDVVLTLFGSSQAADAQSYSTETTVLADGFYTALGTDISTVTTGSDIGGVWHISTNSTLTGDADMTAAGAIFYYAGGIRLDSGITLTLNANVQIRARDGFTCNGTIDGAGNGLVATASGTTGMFNTYSTGGILGNLYEGYDTYQSRDGALVLGNPLNYYTLDNGSTTLTGIPAELRGSSGADGGDVDGIYWPDHDSEGSPPGDPTTANEAGGTGGAGGAGLCVVARGFSCGVAASINLDGEDGSGGTSLLLGTYIMHSGSGGGGAPGGLLILLDGATSTESGVAAAFSAIQGGLSDSGVSLQEAFEHGSGMRGEVFYNHNVHSYYTGLLQRNIGQAAYRVQYVPEDEIPAADVSEITSIPSAIAIQEATGTNNSLNTVVLEISVTAPSDGNYRGSMLYIKKSGSSSYQQIGEAVGAEEVIFYVPGDGSTYDIKAHPISIFGVESSEFYGPVSHTVATSQQAVIGANNVIVTQADPATNGGVIVSSSGVLGYDSSGNLLSDISASTGEITLKSAGGTAKRIEINPSGDNEIHFYGDRGDATVEELATIGIKTVGSDSVIGSFGTKNTGNSKVAIYARSKTAAAIVADTDTGQGINVLGGNIGSNTLAVFSHSSSNSSSKAMHITSSGSGRGLQLDISGGYGVYVTAQTAASDVAPLILRPSGSGAPTHTVGQGAFWTNTSDGLYYYGSSWNKVLIQDAGDVNRASMQTTTVSLAGALPGGGGANITLDGYCFFPMIHSSGGTNITITGHPTDGVGADSPRFTFRNSDPTNDYSYDVDYRHITT